MNKFNIPDKARRREPFYTGRQNLVQTDLEKKYIENIEKGNMPKKLAKTILQTMNPNVAMASREEFAKLIAAVTVMYPHRLDVKLEKTTLRKIFAAACRPEKAEWYFNNIRYRSSLSTAEDKWLGNGTCRNEHLHRRLNVHYRSTIRISKRMLSAQLQAWLAVEMAVFLRAMETDTTVKVTHGDMLPMIIAGIQLFSEKAWSTHLTSPPIVWTSGTPSQRSPDKLRRGPMKEQEEIYKTIRDKTIKRQRETVYASLTQKKLRTR